MFVNIFHPSFIRFKFKTYSLLNYNSFLGTLSYNFKYIKYKIQKRALCQNNQDELEQYLSEENLVFQNSRLNDTSLKNVIVIMPRQKNGSKKSAEYGQLLLDETVTLAKSISYWSVIDSLVISSKSLESRTIFGSTNLDLLKDYVNSKNADSVLFAIDVLKPIQKKYFTQLLNVEIHDRFSTVLKIFRERCSTKESKIQLALAELDYLKKNINNIDENDLNQLSIGNTIGNFDNAYLQNKKDILQSLEHRLKKSLTEIVNTYNNKRSNRSTLEIPSVAVVGYTNCGKTSLIKALTHDPSLTPQNCLFATLDVTTHQLWLPSTKMKCLMIDTIGFISNIPISFVHCFRSTLKEICTADLLIHVVDISNPENRFQIDTVHQTLKEIQVPEKLLNTMIEVSNKVDKISEEDLDKCTGIPISATKRIGLDQLIPTMEKRIIKNTDRISLKLKILNGGEEYQWLYKQAAIVECREDEEDSQYLKMKIILTKSTMGKYIKLFHKLIDDN